MGSVTDRYDNAKATWSVSWHFKCHLIGNNPVWDRWPCAGRNCLVRIGLWRCSTVDSSKNRPLVLVVVTCKCHGQQAALERLQCPLLGPLLKLDRGAAGYWQRTLCMQVFVDSAQIHCVPNRGNTCCADRCRRQSRTDAWLVHTSDLLLLPRRVVRSLSLLVSVRSSVLIYWTRAGNADGASVLVRHWSTGTLSHHLPQEPPYSALKWVTVPFEWTTCHRH